MLSQEAVKARNRELLAADAAEHRTVFRGLPDVVSLHTTEVCNLRCVMCKRSEKLGTRHLDRATLARVCDELFPTATLAMVSGNQGEPLATDFDVVVESALRHGVKIDLVTNGTLLTPQRYAAWSEALNSVNVSLDSHVPEVYESIRVGARFAQVEAHLRGIQAVRAEHPDGVVVGLSAVVMRSNLPHLPDFVRYAARLGLDAVLFQPLRQFDKRTPEEDPMTEATAAGGGGLSGGCPDPLLGGNGTPPAIARFEREARAAAHEVGINLYFSDFGYPAVEPRPLGLKVFVPEEHGTLCGNVARKFALFSTGDVYPCCHPTDHTFGSVLRSEARVLWNGPAAQRLREAHFTRRGTAFCTGCVRAPYLGEAKRGFATGLIKQSRLGFASARNALQRRWWSQWHAASDA